jgi:hypothetical protein
MLATLNLFDAFLEPAQSRAANPLWNIGFRNTSILSQFLFCLMRARFSPKRTKLFML